MTTTYMSQKKLRRKMYLFYLVCYSYLNWYIISFIIIPSLNLPVNVFFSSKNGLRKYQRIRKVDRTGSLETKRMMGPSGETRHLGGVKNKMIRSTDEGGEYYETDAIEKTHAPHLSEIGVQTSIELDDPGTLNKDSMKNDSNKNNENRMKVSFNHGNIKSLEDELKDARAKIGLLEKEKMEIEQKRLVELSSKYVPTSFER